jgi:hypothetical protein
MTRLLMVEFAGLKRSGEVRLKDAQVTALGTSTSLFGRLPASSYRGIPILRSNAR